MLNSKAIDDGDHEHGEGQRASTRLVVRRSDAAQDRLAVAVIEFGDTDAETFVTQRVGKDREERPERLDVAGDAHLAIDQGVQALVPHRQTFGSGEERPIRLVREHVDERHDEAVLVAEVVPDARLGFAGCGRDGRKGQCLVSTLGKQPPRSIEDRPRHWREQVHWVGDAERARYPLASRETTSHRVGLVVRGRLLVCSS